MSCASLMGKTDKNLNRRKELFLENRRITVCEVPYMFGISFGAFQMTVWTHVRLATNFAPPAKWRAEGESCQHMSGLSVETLKRSRTFEDDHRWWDMCLGVLPRNQVTDVKSVTDTHLHGWRRWDKFAWMWRASSSLLLPLMLLLLLFCIHRIVYYEFVQRKSVYQH